MALNLFSAHLGGIRQASKPPGKDNNYNLHICRETCNSRNKNNNTANIYSIESFSFSIRCVTLIEIKIIFVGRRGLAQCESQHVGSANGAATDLRPFFFLHQ